MERADILLAVEPEGICVTVSCSMQREEIRHHGPASALVPSSYMTSKNGAKASSQHAASIYMHVAVPKAGLTGTVSKWRASTYPWHQVSGQTHVSQSGCTCEKRSLVKHERGMLPMCPMRRHDQPKHQGCGRGVDMNRRVLPCEVFLISTLASSRRGWPIANGPLGKTVKRQPGTRSRLWSHLRCTSLDSRGQWQSC